MCLFSVRKNPYPISAAGGNPVAGGIFPVAGGIFPAAGGNAVAGGIFPACTVCYDILHPRWYCPMVEESRLGLSIRKPHTNSIRTYILFFSLALNAPCAQCSRFSCQCSAQPVFFLSCICPRHGSRSSAAASPCHPSLRSSPGAHHLSVGASALLHPLPIAIAHCPLPSAASRSGALLMAPVGHPGLLQLRLHAILLLAALRVHAPSIGQQAAALPTPRLRRQAC